MHTESDARRSPAAAIDEAYRDFAPFVRRQLFNLGVRTADLPDQCHEVFVILNHRSDRLDEIDRIDLWLREVCRRTAAGYRRRAHNAREVLMPNADLPASLDLVEAETADDTLQRLDGNARLQFALDRLDDESRDLLALHDAGEMPLTELAKLVDHDRKTVRKRLEAARRRLSNLLNGDGASSPHSANGPSAAVAAASSPNYARELEVVITIPNLTMGLLGNVVIAIWPGVADLESIETLAIEGPKLIKRCGGQACYLSVVEGSTRPPPLPARQRIVRALDEMGPFVLGYATILLGGMAWLARPIMSGLVVLSRPRFPMRFFTSMSGGTDWLCAHYVRGVDGAIASADLASAAENLRVVQRRA